MAEGARIQRRTQSRLITRELGYAPENRQQLVGELAWAGQDAALLALPQDISAYTTIQDRTTGAIAFMFDFSAFDGPDAWM